MIAPDEMEPMHARDARRAFWAIFSLTARGWDIGAAKSMGGWGSVIFGVVMLILGKFTLFHSVPTRAKQKSGNAKRKTKTISQYDCDEIISCVYAACGAVSTQRRVLTEGKVIRYLTIRRRCLAYS